MNTDSNITLNEKIARLNALAAEQKRLAEELAAEKKATRVTRLNETIAATKTMIAEFTGVPVSDWNSAEGETRHEIAEFLHDVIEALKADAPRRAGATGPRGPRLAEDEKKQRDERIAQALRDGKTAKEVAAEFGLSEGMVNVLKRQYGLTSPRKATTES